MLAAATILAIAGQAAAQGSMTSGTLWAGQFTDAGSYSLIVSDDCSLLTLDVIPGDGWELAEYHVDVVSDPSYFPVNNGGNPVLGHFQWRSAFPPTAQGRTLEISPDDVIDPVVCGDTVYVAVHVELVQWDGSGHVVEEEGAWAGPAAFGPDPWDPSMMLPEGFFEFPGNRWDYYLSFLWEGAPAPPTPTPTPTETPVPPTPTETPAPPTPTETPVPPTPTETPVPPTPTETPVPPTPTNTPEPTDTPTPTPTSTPVAPNAPVAPIAAPVKE